ncbi:MAG: hypothetical protein OXG55_09630 [bacterium]|nr:hypothetical protein [bacterium]MCY4103505.1 hypothetical protein [bacterium]
MTFYQESRRPDRTAKSGPMSGFVRGVVPQLGTTFFVAGFTLLLLAAFDTRLLPGFDTYYVGSRLYAGLVCLGLGIALLYYYAKIAGSPE